MAANGTIQFKIGETYSAPALYGGYPWRIKITGRDDKKGEIYFVYDEHTSDDRSIQTAKIETAFRHIAPFTDHDTVCPVEQIIAWEYQSQYAEEGDVDQCFFLASEHMKYAELEEENEMEDVSID